MTRLGQALAPIEPGARLLCEPWLIGPRLKLWRLIVPAKPLPWLTPRTLTLARPRSCATVTVVAGGDAVEVADLDEAAVATLDARGLR